MGERIRSFDWSKTPLGPIDRWPQSLKTAVRIMLTSRQPFWLGWGPTLIKLYNDAYKSIVGGKHPAALGQPASVVWREIWPEIGPMLETAMKGVEGTYVEEQLLIMERNGYAEETYYTFSYSPIPDDDGRAGGIICANTEDTARVIGDRQGMLLRELASRAADAREVADACRISGGCLAVNRKDIPFGLIYLFDKKTGQLHLAGASDSSLIGTAVAPEITDLNESPWPFRKAFASDDPVVISNLIEFLNLPQGAWQKPPERAALIKISALGEQDQRGVLVVGLNPYRLFDAAYEEFLWRISVQIGTNIRNASAYEAEKRRAEALAELDRAKTAFFSNVSHEFRTPLTLMLGPLEDVLVETNGSLSNKTREQLTVAHRNSIRLLKLVNTLLDFSRIEAGRVRAAFAPTDLPALTAELCSVFRSMIEKAGIRFVVDCHPLDQPVYVDREMWEKIVLNLLSNAFKFTFEGEITVRLLVHGSIVELHVADSGIGIPSVELSNVFKRFHRVEGARGRSFEGSGIGLALVHELVKLHGGDISVTSGPGKGSEFIVSLPLGASHLSPEQLQPADSPGALTPRVNAFIEEAQRWLGQSAGELQNTVKNQTTEAQTSTAQAPHARTKSRVLVADDNADMRGYITRLLSADFEVLPVPDGQQALASLHSFVPDLILSDVMMPGLDGPSLVQAVRADERFQATPVILLSARAGEESRIEGIASGADDYLIKPFSARELVTRVESHLKIARIRRDTFERERALFEELETQRRQSHEILESITDAFIAFDKEWRFTYVNRTAERLMGKSAGELIGRDHWQIFPAVLGTIVEHEFRRAVADNVAVEFENFYAPWRRWFEVKAYPAPQGLGVYFRDITERKNKARKLDVLNQVGAALSSELNLEKLVQAVTDAGRELTGAAFGAFFYNVQNEQGESYTLYTLSGAPREAFEKFPMPRNTAVFAPTFHGEGVVRVADILVDPRYGKNAPYHGMPKGHLPVRSYLAAPVKSRSGEVLGGLFFGHAQPDVFTEESEQLLVGIAAQAGIAIDNANLYRAVQNELAAHKRAEDALRESELKLRTMAESLPNLVWTDLPDGQCDWLSSQWAAYTGIPVKDLLGVNWLNKVIHPDDRERTLACWQAACEDRGDYDLEYRIRRHDGQYRWFKTRGVPIRDQAGKIIYWFGTCTDVEDIKHGHLAIQRLAAIVESSDDAIVSKNLDGIITSWNKGAARLFGYTAEDAIGKSITMLIPPDRLDEEPDILAKIRSGQRIDHFETIRRKKDGTLFNISITVSPIRNDAGEIVGASKVGRDITDRVRAKEKLEQTVAERTAALRDVVAELEAFSYSIAHDMRAPLRAMNSYAQIVREDYSQILPEEGRDFLQRIGASAQRLDALITDVLNYSRISRGDMPLENIAIPALFREVIDSYPAIRAYAQNISVELGIPAVRANKAALTQCISNLLSNAVKFTRDDVPPIINVRSEPEAGFVRIWVEDNGIGISEEGRKRIFHMFQRLNPSPNVEGTGIGLTIVRKAVERMGGHVGVESQPNVGSRFWIELPAAE